MNTREIKDYLLYHCPDISVLKKYLARKKIEELRHRMLTEAEVVLGETSWEEKKKIIDAYISRKPKYAEKAERKIDSLFQNAPCFAGRKDLDQIRTDMHFCRFAYGFEPDEYVFFCLEGKNPNERKSYISNLERIIASFQMNDFSDMQIFNDKWKTYSALKAYYKRDAEFISKPAHFSRFEEFVKKHPVFVKKQIGLSWGQSIGLVDSIHSEKTTREIFDNLIAQGKIILEERIVQSSQMSAFNDGSVNTIRCVTLNTKHGIKIFPYSFMKNGRKGSFVDNGGAGGILIGIDDATGIVDTDGMDELGRIYSAHPDSGVVYQGFQIPEWDAMIAICKEAAAQFPRMKYCSWDMAHTENGWVIVEANMAGQMVAQQMTIQQGIKAELYKYMENMDLLI